MGKLVQLSGSKSSIHESAEYLRHFGISQCPFSTPGTEHTFWQSHGLEDLRGGLKKALAAAGLTLVSEPTSQLTSPARELILDIFGDVVTVACIDALPQTAQDFLLQILTSFGFDSIEPEISECRRVMEAFLVHGANAGNPPVILLQQAEPTNEAVADEIGRLLNLRESGRPCVRLVMLGKPEAISLNKVHYSDLPISHFDLKGLHKDEVSDFVFARLEESGLKGRALFTPAAIAHIAEVSGRVPGVINQVCACAMLCCFEQGEAKVTKSMLVESLTSYEFSLPQRTVEDIVVDCIAGQVLENDHDDYGVGDRLADQPEAGGKISEESEQCAYFDMSRNGKHIARFLLDGGRLTIGRHNSNEIYVPCAGISLFHAVVTCENNEAHIFDLRSTNGTVVNGRDISRKRLSKGDVVTLGDLRLDYCPGTSSENNVSNILNFTETVVLEEDESSEPTVYIRSGV